MNNVWTRHGREAPPVNLNYDFFKWLQRMESDLTVTFVDPLPMDAADLGALETKYGHAPAELREYYRYASPWHGYANGPELWDAITEQAFETARPLAVREEASYNGLWSPKQPALWPVSLGTKVDVGAFADASGQLAVVELRGERRRAYPKALGLWNYLVGLVLAELLVDRGEYDTLDEAYRDADVMAAFNWPQGYEPEHPLLIHGWDLRL